RPRRIELCDDAVLQFESRIRCIVSGTLVSLALFIDSLRNVSCTETRDCLNFSEYIVEDVTPVTKHVDDNAAVVFAAVIPRWPLCRDGISFKNPVPELSTHRKYFAEKSLRDETF